jgi:ubiquinol-cytochrome c reductase cytochrome c1 subunit
MRIMKFLAAGLIAVSLTGTALAAGKVKHPEGPEYGWSFDGPFGTYDRAAVQRGFQVYKEVCSACHGLKLMSYRNLGQKGGPFYDPKNPNPNDNAMVKAIAAGYTVTDGPDEVGDMFERPGRPSDRFLYPYPNEQAGRAANGGAYPPDLSVMVKARKYGADYIYNLMIGYVEPPEGLTVPPGQYYNPYFPGDTKANWSGDPHKAPKGGMLAMPNQLIEGRVEYMDGTEASVEQMAHDVTQFLAWSAEPKMEARKSLGIAVLGYLFGFALLLYLSYRQIWRNVQH